jgi:hypothetical protein
MSLSAIEDSEQSPVGADSEEHCVTLTVKLTHDSTAAFFEAIDQKPASNVRT